MNRNERNIVLIGMPGCGKTTIGKLLAEHLGRKFTDLDSYIEKKQGLSINEIFRKGEQEFRRLESEAIITMENEKNTIIATGGGVVKNPSNMASLSKNGIIVYIDRSIGNIAGDIRTDTRPLLAEGKERLEGLYSERHKLYEQYSDLTVKNDGNLQETLENIISFVKTKA